MDATDGTRDFNISLSEAGPGGRKSVRTELNSKKSINCLGINGIYRLLHLTTADLIFFSSLHRTLTKKYFLFLIIKQRTSNHMVSSITLQWN